MVPDPELVVKYFRAALNMPTSIPKLIEYFKGIYNKMNGDSRYSGSATRLATFNDQTKDLDEKQAAYKEKPPAVSKQVRDDAKKLAVSSAKTLRNDVQDLADATPSYAEEIITGANMTAIASKGRPKQKSEIKDTNESGTVEVFGEGQGYHEWLQSENGTDWVPLKSTSTAHLIVTGLVVGKTYYFKSRKILTKGEYGPWSVPVSVVAR
jgi:hypothetical protein